MAYDLKLEGNVKGVGNVHYVEAPFDEEMKLFDANGLRLISARQLAIARMPDAHSSFSQNGSWIKEGDLYIPANLAGKASIVLLEDSLVLQDPKEATDAHRKGNEYLVDNDEAMELLEKAKKGNKFCFLLTSADSVPTNRFGEEGVTVFLFGKDAKDYGLWLKKEKDKNAMPLYFDGADHINNQKGAYANQLWLGWLGDYSVVDGGRGLSCNGGACGVQSTAEGGRLEKPAVKTYNPSDREVERNLRIAQEVMKGTRPAKDLEKLVTLLEKFRKN